MIWLATGLPALLVFWFMPVNPSAMGTIGPLIMVLELSYVGAVANAAVALKDRTGRYPWSDRIRLIPYAGGMLAYALIFLGYIPSSQTPAIGTAAILMIALSKILISGSDIRPAPIKLRRR